MTAAEILAIIQIVSALTPEAITLVSDLKTAFSDTNPDERAKALSELQAALKPMALKE